MSEQSKAERLKDQTEGRRRKKVLELIKGYSDRVLEGQIKAAMHPSKQGHTEGWYLRALNAEMKARMEKAGMKVVTDDDLSEDELKAKAEAEKAAAEAAEAEAKAKAEKAAAKKNR